MRTRTAYCHLVGLYKFLSTLTLQTGLCCWLYHGFLIKQLQKPLPCLTSDIKIVLGPGAMTTEAQASLWAKHWEGNCQDTDKQPPAKPQAKLRSSAVPRLRSEQNNEEIIQAGWGSLGALVAERLDRELQKPVGRIQHGTLRSLHISKRQWEIRGSFLRDIKSFIIEFGLQPQCLAVHLVSVERRNPEV